MFLKSLAAIGLATDPQSPSSDIVKRLADEATESVETEAGLYRVCRLAGGGEVWLHIGRPGGPQEGRIVGITPFQSGEGAIRVRVANVVQIDEIDRLAGAYLCYLPAPRRGDRELNVLLEMVPFRQMRRPASPAYVPAYVDVQVLALASEAAVYPGLPAYLNSVPKERLISPGAIAPILQSSEVKFNLAGAVQMRCMALVTGVVKTARRIVNPLTGQDYWWVLLDTDRGPVNLAVHAGAVSGAGAPAAGCVLQGRARLVGRDLGFAEEQAGWVSPLESLSRRA